jgi:two-component system chemotaxis response regulator CheY
MAKSVLIVDDTMFIRRLLKDILEKNGITDIIEAPDGDAALRMYIDNKPDVVLMDVNMPEKDGLTAIREIIAYDHDANIAVCSAMSHRDTVMTAVREGAKDFIVKPFLEERVMETLDKLA